MMESKNSNPLLNHGELVKLIQESFEQNVILLKEYGITVGLRNEWMYYVELRNASRDRSYLPLIVQDMRKMLKGYVLHGRDFINAIPEKELESAVAVFLDGHKKEIDDFWEFYKKNLVPK